MVKRLALIFASAIAAAALAATLRVRTDFARLLPADAPSVVALHALAARKSSTAVVEVGVASADASLTERFALALAAELRKLPPELAREIDDDDAPLRRFAWNQRFLRVPLDELRRAKAHAVNPFFVDLDGDEGPNLMERLASLRRQTIDRPAGYLGEEGRLRMILVRAPFGDSEPGRGKELLERIRAAVARLGPPQGVEIGYAGDVVTAALEHDLVLRDVGITAALCLLLVLGVLRAAFRSTRAVLALLGALLVGCAWTFAWARLCIGELNSATAFLGPMVAGNGINAGIILLARYLEERRMGDAHEEALRTALRETWRPTLLASACAAAADLSLLLTRFRAFSEFGAIAAAGMALCWIATYLTLPLLLGALRIPVPPRRERPPRAPRLFSSALVALGAMAVGFVGLRGLPLRFQDDLRSLRSRSLPLSEAGRWSRRLDAAFGRNQAGGFFIGAQSAEEVRDAVARLQADRSGIFGKIDALPRVLPGTECEQRERIALLKELRGGFPPELRPPPDLHPLTERDLPPALREAFTETDGRVGLLLVVHPGPAFDGWSVAGIRRAVGALRAMHFAQNVQISGPEVIFADMMREVETALPRAALASTAFACVLLAAMFGPTLLGAAALLAMAAGLLGMLAGLSALHVRLDFLSALALPITIGIAGDYPLNVLARVRRGWDGLRRTQAAVLLCSLTTGIGYAVLLASDTGAIRSFGLAALLGEASCLCAALLVAPALARLAQSLRRG